MSRSRLLSFILLLALTLPACARRETVDQAPELTVVMAIVPSPPQPGSAILIIQIMQENGINPGDFTLDVRGDMSHAGMKPVIVEAVPGEAGAYSIPFEFSMAGDWLITLSAVLPDGRSLIRTYPIRVEP